MPPDGGQSTPPETGQAAQPDPNAAAETQTAAAGAEQAVETTTTTTTTQAEPKTSAKAKTDDQSLMDHLGIPQEIQEQIKPKAEEKPKESEVAQTPEATAETPEPEAEELTTASPSEGEEQPGQQQPDKIDKRQKRINRLTRQKSQLEEQLDLAVQQNQQLRETIQKSQVATAGQPKLAAAGSGPLGTIWSETELNKRVDTSRALRDWCLANPDGATTGEGDKQVFHDATEIGKWRQNAESVLLEAPLRRDQIRQFTQTQSYFDGLARTEWPELFDRSSPEHQHATAIMTELEGPNGAAMVNYCMGLVMEGLKSRDARKVQTNEANGNGAEKPKGDLDQRFLRPRVPLAPHTAGPPSRGSAPSSQKKVNEAMNNLVADPDGGASSLARVFEAQGEADRGRSNPRAPVTV